MKNKRYKIPLLFVFGGCIIFFMYKCGLVQINGEIDDYVFCREGKRFHLSKFCDDKYSTLSLRLQDLECKQNATWFSGLIALNLLKKKIISDKVNVKLAFTNESHGSIPFSIECKKFGSEKYDKYCTGKENDIIFVPNKGFSHIKYPLDDYKFGFNILFDKKEISNLVDKINISNRTNTFKFVEKPKVEIEDKKIKIKNLKIGRTKLIPIFYFTFALFVFLFLCALFFENDVKTLAISISAVFFSIFSVRNVVDKEIKIFPTYLDFFIILSLLSFTILLLIKIIRTLWQKRKR